MEDQNSAPLVEYKYTPLQRLNPLRLLFLYPADSYDAPIRILLGETSLDTSAKFGALSYTWASEEGDRSLSKRIECDGAFVKITSNCEAALRGIRLGDVGQILWVDSICIDQSNNAEKSLQVQTMCQIYRKAKFVWVWIGEASSILDEETARPLTDLGMDFIHEFATELQEKKSSGQNVRDGQLYQEVIRGYKAFHHGGIDAFSPSVRGLWEILHRSWWKRLWIIQELALAQVAILRCGSKTETFDKVETVITGMAGQHLGKSVEEHVFLANFITCAFPPFIMRDFVKRAEIQNNSILGNLAPGQKALEILDSTRTSEATDPRDKIYGILGFFGDPESDPENILPLPDYSKTTAEVYSEVARAIVTKTKSLDVLSSCYGFINSMPNLPSWAPSWNHIPLKYFSEDKFSAAKSSFVVYEEAEDNSYLKVKGRMVDLVRDVTNIPKTLEYNNLECASLWLQWSEMAFSLHSYPTGEDVTEVLQHSLCWNTNALYHRLAPGEYQDAFEAWLAILRSGNSLETIADRLFKDEVAYTYSRRASYLTWGRNMSTTSKSYLAMVPVGTSPGDQIAILSGGKIPFILRATGDTFKLIGPCYVHGIMDGEAFPEQGEDSEELEWLMLC